MIQKKKITPFTQGLLVGLGLFLFLGLNGQQTRFSHVYKPAVDVRGIVEKDQFYYGIAPIRVDSIGKFAVRLLKLDSNGTLIQSRDFITNEAAGYYASNHFSIIKTLDGNFVTNLNVGFSNPRKNGILKFNENLDTLWLRFFTGKGSNFPNQIKQLEDSNFIVTGTDYDSIENNTGAFLMKADSLGNYLWHKTYHEPDDSFSLRIRHVYLAPDGGFLMAGNRRVFGNDNEYTADALLIKTDSLGNKLWQKTYGSNNFDDFAAAGYLGNQIVLFYPEYVKPFPGNFFTTPVFKVIDDQNGQELNTYRFPHIEGINLSSSTLLIEDDKIIGAGRRWQEKNEPGPDPGTGRGYSLALDLNFNPLWYQQYTFRASTPDIGEKSRLRDFRPTSDGGYVGAGTLETFDTLGTGANLGYTAWVFKIDSNGCLRDPCVNSINLPEQETEETLLSIYPSPSSQYFNIEWTGVKNASAQLLDLQGRVLESIALIQGVGVLNPPEHLPNGLYIIRVGTRKGEVRTQKVVLQR
jgi:hypothetical protein